MIRGRSCARELRRGWSLAGGFALQLSHHAVSSKICATRSNYWATSPLPTVQLALLNHVHPPVTHCRSPGCPEKPEVLAGLHASSDGPMVLLQDVVQTDLPRARGEDPSDRNRKLKMEIPQCSSCVWRLAGTSPRVAGGISDANWNRIRRFPRSGGSGGKPAFGFPRLAVEDAQA
jgi:hypothetical protein